MSTATSFTPLNTRTGETVRLAMQRLWLTGQILPAGGRLVAQHVFRSDEQQPLEVIYSFPLPRDAALRRFRIAGEGFEAHSELKETEAAVKAYEAGIAQGSLSSLARAYGDGVMNLTVGNIRPHETITVWVEILCGVELRDDGFRFRFPFALAPAYHSRARTAVLATGEGEMELPADEFGDVILPRFREDATDLHEIGFELSIVGQSALREIGSPSHAVRIKQDGRREAQVILAAEKDIPNRDLVLDARFHAAEPIVLAGRDSEGKAHFAAIVPSTSFGANTAETRRVVVLLDRSGSMQGPPIAQAKKAIEACLQALSETDSFGLIAFDNQPEVFQRTLVPGTLEWRDKAHQFLEHVEARGGTELAQGFRTAAQMFGGSGGDVVILTDGQVSGTEQILAEARATGVRLHCLGIGSASQDRFLSLLARETGGVSRFVTPRERVDLSAVDLFASIGRPVASGLKAGTNVQPEPPQWVFSGTPVILFGECSAEPEVVELSWDGGKLALPVDGSDAKIGETVRLLQGARLITDWESRYPSAAALAPLEKRKQNRVAARLLELSKTYGLASREMALVAVVTRQGDRPGELPETRVVPMGMAQDTAFQAYFARTLFAAALDGAIRPQIFPGAPHPEAARAPLSSDLPSVPLNAALSLRRASRGAELGLLEESQHPTILMTLASRMLPDGGMPGNDADLRACATALSLLAFLSKGHAPTKGAFRSHVARLVSYLKSVTGLTQGRDRLVANIIKFAEDGLKPEGKWIYAAEKGGDQWGLLGQVAVPSAWSR